MGTEQEMDTMNGDSENVQIGFAGSSYLSSSSVSSIVDVEPQCSQFKIYQNEEDKIDGADEFQNTVMIPTNAFGQMEFVGGESKTRAKYIRLSDQTELTDIEKLIKFSWGLKEWPKVLISVLGGVHGFNIKPNVTNNLKKELRNLCLKVSVMPSETWFITKGNDSGVTKLVADAMQGSKYKNTAIIGITLWEKLHGREDLIQAKDNIKIAKYLIKKDTMIKNREKSNEYYLNKEHTHYFLVDTGRTDCINREARFHLKFMNYVIGKQVDELREPKTSFAKEKSFVPAASLVINGGIRTLAQVKANLCGSPENKLITPVVVVAGTGRVADWLTFAYENDVHCYDELKEMIHKIYPDNCLEVFNDILACMKQRKHISIYHPFQSQSLNEVILRTMITTGRDRKDPHISFEQLRMIMQWGREDIAEEELTKLINDKTADLKKIKSLLQELMLLALRLQKMEFYDMILRIAFEMSAIDKHLLVTLYSDVYLKDIAKQGNTLFTFLKPDSHQMNVMNRERRDSERFNNSDKKKALTSMETHLLSCVKLEINKLLSLKVVDYYDNGEFEVDDPEKELFLWSILCNKPKVATVFYKRGDDPMAKALIARKMFNKMATRYKLNHPFFDEHVYKALLRRARYFEMEAMNLMEKCSKISTTQTASLVNLPLPRWSDKTCMDLAALSQFEQFIAHQRCQDITGQVWRGDFALYGRYFHIKIISGIFCPPLLMLLNYKPTYKHEDKFCCRSTQLHKKMFCKARDKIDKVLAFYKAPVTKFWRNTIFYMFFLFCFALLTLNRLKTHVEFYEGVVLAFILAFTLDEVRSLYLAPGINFRQKLHAWWADPWNKIDCLAQATFLLAFALRICGTMHHNFYLYARLTYAFNFVLWTLRLLQVISLHERIGVYIVMLQRMVGDVIYFIAICLVFSLGYGIARYSVLYPDRGVDVVHGTFDPHFGQRIISEPLFQVVGEMFLDTTVNRSELTVFSTILFNDSSETFMLILQYAYVILTNILFINLLIAVFNNTYESVESHSDRIWKWQYYVLVNDIQEGCLMPAPISICENIILLIIFVFQKLCGRKKIVSSDKDQRFIPITEYFEKDTLLNSMKQFENECLSKYLIERAEYVQKLLRKKQIQYGGGTLPVDSSGGHFQEASSMLATTIVDNGFLLYGSDDDDDDDD